jgi:hypothetical protein
MILRTLGQQPVGRPTRTSAEPSLPTKVADTDDRGGTGEALATATRTQEVVSIGVSAYQRATLSPLDRARILRLMEEATANRRAGLEDGDDEYRAPTIAGSRFLRELRHRDSIVRVQEAAFRARNRDYGSGASYEYEFGSDGLRYAVAGELSVQGERTSSAAAPSGDGAEWIHAAGDELVRVRLEADVATASAVGPAEFVGGRGPP